MRKRLEGKVALVTGGGRGIGRAISMHLAEEGGFVVIHYGHRVEMAHAAVNEIRHNGGTAASVKADLSSLRGIGELFAGVDDALSQATGSTQIDILVNNAGIALQGGVNETTEENCDAVFAVNAKAPFFVVQHALSRLRDNGRIINISSAVTRIGFPSLAAYSMTKGALDTLSLLLAKQLGARGITVNSLAPGVIDTEMNAALLGDPQGRRYAASISALGRVGTPADVADAAAFLASADGRWVTGQRLDVSGGSLIG